jgi:hypothetical protein
MKLKSSVNNPSKCILDKSNLEVKCSNGYTKVGDYKCILDSEAKTECEMDKLAEMEKLKEAGEWKSDYTAGDWCENTTGDDNGCVTDNTDILKPIKKSCAALGFPFTGYCQYCHTASGGEHICDCCYADYVLFNFKACCAYN